MSDIAVAVKSGVQNVQLQPAAENVPRKILIIGTGDPTTEAANLLDTPILVTSSEDVADQTGFGFMLHRLAIKSFKGSDGKVETWMIQQAESTPTQAVGEIDFTGSTGVLAGTLNLYIGAESVPIVVTAAMTVEELADATVAAIAANPDLPITSTKTAVTFEVVPLAKSGGTYGNDISIAFNLGAGETTPTGITVAVVDMATGAGLPDIQTALDSLGTSDDANENFFTQIIASAYGLDTTTLDAIADYVGQGTGFIGLWSKTVHRPFTSVFGDVATGSGGLSAIVAIGNGRRNDRANGVISVPASNSHPAEIAAQWAGAQEEQAKRNPAVDYNGILLSGVDPGAKADRWNNSLTNRNTAALAGVSPTIIKSGAVFIQNSETFYHPASVPVNNNGYKDIVNIAKLQNINDNLPANFEQSKWNGKTIVDDVTKVGDVTAKADARDIDAFRNDMVALLEAFESKAWIAQAAFSIDSLVIAINGGGDGFTTTLDMILSGNVRVIDITTSFDTSFASIT